MSASRSRKEENKVVRMLGGTDKDIILDKSKAVSCFNTKIYDRKINVSNNFWNEILVHHEGLYRKAAVLKQFVKYFNGHDFFPVAYQSEPKCDTFYVRLSKEAMDILFSNCLKIVMPDGRLIHLTVNINVASFQPGQITAQHKIEEIVKIQHTRKEYELSKGLVSMNFNSLYDKFIDIHISFANEYALELLLREIVRIPNTDVNGLKLNGNGIRSLCPFVLLEQNIIYLDLGQNDIENGEDLKNLSKLGLRELNLEGNPVSEKRNFQYKVSEHLPQLKTLNHKMINVKPEQDSLVVDKQSGDLISARDLDKNIVLNKYRMSKKWHQIEVLHGGRSSKQEILDAFSTLIEHQEFFICYYKIGKHSDIFLVRNCLDAIDTMIKNRLELLVRGGEQKIPLQITMNVKEFSTGEVDYNNIIIEVLSGRFNLMDKVLNLESFAKSPQIKDVIFDMSNSKTLSTVLTFTNRKYGPQVQHIKLRKNGIKSGKGMNTMAFMKQLKTLDLGENNISDLQTFIDQFPPNMKITELILAGNPMCATVESTNDYVTKLTKMFSELQRLDGYIVKPAFQVWNRNFLCDLQYHDMVETFIGQYFGLYDSIQRTALREYYHPKALFSMCMFFESSKITVSNAERVNRYNMRSRNCLKMANYNNFDSNLCIGSAEIMDYFRIMPLTEHDFYSFSVDVTIAREDLICFTINGLFKEIGSSLNESEFLVGFTRTFVLKPYVKGLGLFNNTINYCITNDQMNLFNLLLPQVRVGFTTQRPVDPLKTELTSAERDDMVKLFQQLTKMKYSWSEKCLIKANWILSDALSDFVTHYKVDKFPEIAFEHE